MMNETRYVYLGNDADHGKRDIISIGYKFDDVKVKLAFSFCSHKNDRFSRKMAHQTIETRFAQSKELTIPYQGKAPSYSEIISISKQMLQIGLEAKEITGVQIPTWARKEIRTFAV